MSNILLIRALEYPPNKFEWLKWNTSTQQQVGIGELLLEELSILQSEAIGSLTILAIPGQYVRALKTPLPKKALLSSLPFIIEESLSTPIEQMHVVPGKFDNNQIEAFAIPHEQMQFWIQLFQNAGIEILTITPDYQLLQNDPHSDIAWQERTQVLINTDMLQASLSISFFNALSYKLLPEIPDLIYYGETAPLTEINFVTKSKPLLETFARQFSMKRPPVNLLQGQYKRQNNILRYLDIFKGSLIALASMVIILFAGVILENITLKQSIQKIDNSMTEIYRESFPQAQRIINPLSQMKAQINQLSTQSNRDTFIKWLAITAPILKQHSLTLLNLRFSESPPSLKLQLQANSYNSMEQLNIDIKESGLQAELGALVKNQQNVTGVLTVKDK